MIVSLPVLSVYKVCLQYIVYYQCIFAVNSQFTINIFAVDSQSTISVCLQVDSQFTITKFAVSLLTLFVAGSQFTISVCLQ